MLKLKYLFIILVNLSLFSGVVNAQYTPVIWDVMRRQFELNHEENRPEVKKQIKWIVSHPTYLKRLVQSEPYIYHIVSEIRRRHLPGELALVPLIESAYNPFTYSGAGAAGLWQLMPGTGSGLGLKRDWWHDGRRSIGPSTDAALNYLAYLKKYFTGNWLLAIAAYNSGEGKMSRIIKKSSRRKKPNFWSLPVPKETKGYIPRLLALAAIIQNPQRYNVKLPDIPHSPYFAEVDVGSQIDLDHAAKLAGISYQELIKLNPEYNRWTTRPYQPYKLLIPVSKAKVFRNKLSNIPHEERVSWKRHLVAKGETLIFIAKRHHTTVKLIKELNQLKSNAVTEGQYILIPSTKKTSPTKVVHSGAQDKQDTSPKHHANNHYKVIHIVQRKETYAKLKKQYGVSEEVIKRWNMIGPHVPLTPGQQLVIWKQKNQNKANHYTVAKGDNLSQIAQKQQTKVSTLLQLNPGLKKHLIKPGQQIKIQ